MHIQMLYQFQEMNHYASETANRISFAESP